MAKVTPDEQLALELVPIQKKMERLEEEHDSAVVKIPELERSLSDAKRRLGEIFAELEPLRKEWDERIEGLNDPWKTLLTNERARKQVTPPKQEPVSTGQQVKTIPPTEFHEWLRNTFGTGEKEWATVQADAMDKWPGHRKPRLDLTIKAGVVKEVNGKVRLAD